MATRELTTLTSSCGTSIHARAHEKDPARSRQGCQSAARARETRAIPETAALTALLVALIDERIATALAAREGAPYTTSDLPPGIDRRAFHARCRELAAAGSSLVWKPTPSARTWVAQREAFEVRAPARRTANDAPKAYVAWSVDAAIGESVRKAGTR